MAKKIIIALLVVQIAAAAILIYIRFCESPKRLWQQELYAASADSVKGFTPEFAAYLSEKHDELAASLREKYGDGIEITPGSTKLVRDDKSVMVFAVDMLLREAYTYDYNGTEAEGLRPVGTESFEMWFDLTDTQDGLPDYTLMPRDDSVFYPYEWADTTQ